MPTFVENLLNDYRLLCQVASKKRIRYELSTFYRFNEERSTIIIVTELAKYKTLNNAKKKCVWRYCDKNIFIKQRIINELKSFYKK